MTGRRARIDRGLRALALSWALLWALLWALPAAALPSFDEVKASHRPSDLTLLDRHGTPLQTLRVDPGVRRRPWVAIADLSPALLQAIVLSEDRRFWQHSGVDWPAVARSAWANTLNTRTQGASTLTMQLAGLVDDGLARPAAGRGLGQKIGQAITATQLEARWTKHQILEAYLNAVPFRGELVGINALSQTLFGKHPGGLDGLEAAIAAALVRRPNGSPERVAQRACGVLTLQLLDCSGLTGLATTALQRRGGMPLGEQLAPHFARQLLRADGSLQALWPQRSTLDAPLQRVALAALRQQLVELSDRNVEDGAIVVLDNASGEVRAWVGSSGSFSDAPAVDGVLARRQSGSTLKPFVYGLAFQQRLITPASLLDDSPAQINTAAGLYLPQNYDRRFRGWVSARTALGASPNVPAVRAAALLGPDALVQRLNDFGLALPEPSGFYGHALALGAADVTLLALTNAYRALANGGWWSPVAGLRGPEFANTDARAAGNTAAGNPAPPPPRGRRCGGAPGQPHPGRQQRARRQLRARQCAGHARLRGGEDRHQQRPARRLMHRLHRPLHRGRVGGQRQRRGDASGQWHQRCRAGVARAGAAAACRAAVAAATAAARGRRLGHHLRGRAGAAAYRALLGRHRAGVAAHQQRDPADGRRQLGLRHHQPARRQRVRARPRHPACRAAHHL